MNSLERLIGILDLFGGTPGILTADDLHARLGYTRSTLYRYLKILTDAGLLASYHGVGFALGPRIIELNATIVSSDPLIRSSKLAMQTLALQHGCVALLCRRFKDKVLCVHQEEGAEGLTTYYQVGQARSLVRGAASRVILANLPAATLRKVYQADPASFADAGLGADLVSVRRRLRRIREARHDVSIGEVMPGITAVAAPVLDGAANVIGSLCLSLPQAPAGEGRLRGIAEQVIDVAERVGQTLG